MKVFSVVKYVFIVMGVAMLLGALMSYRSSSSFLADAVSVKGTVMQLVENRSEDSITYKPVVQFVEGGGRTIEFVSSVGGSRSSYAVGQAVDVLYLPENPQDAKINSFSELWLGVVIMGVMGAPFFLIGALIFLSGKLKTRKKDDLQRNGEAVSARFQAVQLNRKVSVNGCSPFVVVCHWLNPQTSEVHVFESDNIWFDPSGYIKGEEMMVFMKKGNPRKYHVDISFLPKMAR